MIFWISDNSYAPTKRSNNIAFRDSLFSVIRALGMYVWPYCKKQFCDVRFVEYCNQVNRFKRRDNLSPLTFGQYRAALAFQPGYLIIGIDSNDQQVPQRSSA